MGRVRALTNNTFEIWNGVTTEDLAMAIDQFGTIDQDFDFTGITFNVVPTIQNQVTYNSIQYYVTYTLVGTVWTQRFYTVTGHTGTTEPFITIQITA